MKIRFSGEKKKHVNPRVDPKKVKERIRASKRIPQGRKGKR
ncbi:MAG: hypothetical protein V2A74_01195 [bacterium]